MTVKDIKQIVAYWTAVSNEDLKVARDLFRSKKYSYCLFFCHLTLEKLIKALVVTKTREHAPRTHNLLFLAGQAGLSLSKDDLDFLAEMTRWNLEARYPSDLAALKKAATFLTARSLFKKTETFLKWLKKLLLKNS